MKSIYCDKCGVLTAKLEKGSSIHPKAIMLCGNCNSNVDDSDLYSSSYDDSSIFGDDSLDFLKSMMGLK